MKVQRDMGVSGEGEERMALILDLARSANNVRGLSHRGEGKTFFYFFFETLKHSKLRPFLAANILKL